MIQIQFRFSGRIIVPNVVVGTLFLFGFSAYILYLGIVDQFYSFYVLAAVLFFIVLMIIFVLFSQSASRSLAIQILNSGTSVLVQYSGSLFLTFFASLIALTLVLLVTFTITGMYLHISTVNYGPQDFKSITYDWVQRNVKLIDISSNSTNGTNTTVWDYASYAHERKHFLFPYAAYTKNKELGIIGNLNLPPPMFDSTYVFSDNTEFAVVFAYLIIMGACIYQVIAGVIHSSVAMLMGYFYFTALPSSINPGKFVLHHVHTTGSCFARSINTALGSICLESIFSPLLNFLYTLTGICSAFPPQMSYYNQVFSFSCSIFSKNIHSMH